MKSKKKQKSKRKVSRKEFSPDLLCIWRQQKQEREQITGQSQGSFREWCKKQYGVEVE